MGYRRMPSENFKSLLAQHQGGAPGAVLYAQVRTHVEEGVYHEDDGRGEGTDTERDFRRTGLEEDTVLHQGEGEKQAGRGIAVQVVEIQDGREREAQGFEFEERDQSHGTQTQREPLR